MSEFKSIKNRSFAPGLVTGLTSLKSAIVATIKELKEIRAGIKSGRMEVRKHGGDSSK